MFQAGNKAPVFAVGLKSDLREDLPTIEALRNQGEMTLDKHAGTSHQDVDNRRVLTVCYSGEAV